MNSIADTCLRTRERNWGKIGTSFRFYPPGGLLRFSSLVLLLVSSLCAAQGRDSFLNLEIPQVAPIVVARVGGLDVVLACNTPDNRLEIYDVRGLRFLARVPVGLRPVSVSYDPVRGVAYTADMLGDSVTRILLTRDPLTKALRARVDRTVYVGDEPMMVLPSSDGKTLFVTKNTRNALAWVQAKSLLPVVPGYSERIPLLDSFQNPTQALRHPRFMAMGPQGNLHVLGFLGGHSWLHDSDLWSFDFKTRRASMLGGLGTCKTGMAFQKNGDLWVIAWDAQNQRVSEPVVAAAPTGFVKSLLHRIRGLGTSKVSVETRDLNLSSLGKPVSYQESLAHPMGIQVYEPKGGAVKIFVAAFHRDRIGVVLPGQASAAQWKVRGFSVPRAVGSGNPMAGPRGLALRYGIPGVPGDPGDRLYVMNRLDNSIAEVDPVSEKVLRVRALQNDPTPPYIRKGRRFLYDAGLSGNGFDACASCHIDGRSDGLGWDLSAGSPSGAEQFNPQLVDGVTDQRILSIKQKYPFRKGVKVTQSMQGLATSEVQGLGQRLFTNNPLHWRGDRPDLSFFNAAYVGLMGMKNLAPPGQRPRGIPIPSMRVFEEFSFSIHFPPNPDEPIERRYSGSFGAKDAEDGSGALLGLKLFHTRALRDPLTNVAEARSAGRSCVQCHSLPAGSNNRLTSFSLGGIPQVIETPHLRGLQAKEARWIFDPFQTSKITTNEFGLGNSGAQADIVDFTQFGFAHDFLKKEKNKLDAIARFLREFDTGIAPSVGLSWTVAPGQESSPGTRFMLDLFEGKTRSADAGLAVHALLAGKELGFWFDPLQGSYRTEPGGKVLGRAALLGLLRASSDRLVFLQTPLGSARRVAAPSGRASILRGPPASRIELLPMPVASPWTQVPLLDKNWIPGPKTHPKAFVWEGVYSGTSTKVPEPVSLKALRVMQLGLLQDSPGFGLQRLRHEAPRRFRVAAKDLRPGAKLLLFTTTDPKSPPPHKNFKNLFPLVLPLYPSGRKTRDGRPIYETAAEMKPEWTYTLMLGGTLAPGVAAAREGRLPEPPKKGSFDPIRWNKHWVWILQEDGGLSTGGWQRIRIE